MRLDMPSSAANRLCAQEAPVSAHRRELVGQQRALNGGAAASGAAAEACGVLLQVAAHVQQVQDLRRGWARVRVALQQRIHQRAQVGGIRRRNGRVLAAACTARVYLLAFFFSPSWPSTKQAHQWWPGACTLVLTHLCSKFHIGCCVCGGEAAPHDLDGDGAQVAGVEGLAQAAHLVQDAAQRPHVRLGAILPALATCMADTSLTSSQGATCSLRASDSPEGVSMTACMQRCTAACMGEGMHGLQQAVKQLVALRT